MTARPLSAAAVAREILGRSPSWFYQHRADLEAAGFPCPLPVVNRYDPEAVRAWMRRSSGLDPQDNAAGKMASRAILDRLLGDAA